MCSLPLFAHLKVENDVSTLKSLGKNKKVKHMNMSDTELMYNKY